MGQVAIDTAIPARVEKKGDWWIARCDVLALSSQGETREKALVNLGDAITFFFESCARREVVLA